MGRRLQFDKRQALELAMENFWALGYESTSMRNIANDIGIHLGSLYNALGDKDAVFEKSLKLNLDTHVLPALTGLAMQQDPLGALDAFMDKVVDECARVDNSPGCFLINSLLELTAISEEVTATLHDYMHKIESGFQAVMERAVMAGQLPEKTDTRAKARFIIATLFSMRVMGKMKMPPDFIRDIKCSVMIAVKAK